jgi:23S rRNA (cytidine1920-2'-O)/16S rRNA (cytidine1409-2'-O)-methyltransferase
VGRKGRRRLRRLRDEVARVYPYIENPEEAIRRGAIVVDGRVMSNPESLIRESASIALAREPVLRGEPKLRAALEAFRVLVRDRVALDVGASAGGFTRVLLQAGAERVYAVDVGHGQLLGSLRRDPRVVNLERTNIASLDTAAVPEPIDVITIDLSYLALWRAVPQLRRVRLSRCADAIALVKPQFELGLATPPSDQERLLEAVQLARAGFEANNWIVDGVIESPVRGSRGAVEFLLHARVLGEELLGGLGETTGWAVGARCSPRGRVLSRTQARKPGRSLRPCLGTTIAPRRRATFRQALLGVEPDR